MIFSTDKKTGLVSAEIRENDQTIKYECSFEVCPNPTCECGIVTIDFIPMHPEEATEGFPLPHTVDIDVIDQGLAHYEGKDLSPEDRTFEDRLLKQMDEEDFNFLYRIYFKHKNTVTKKAKPSEIDALFDYEAIEVGGLKTAYHEILPYDDMLSLDLDGQNLKIIDQYCLKLGCPCTSATLTFLKEGEEDSREASILGTVEADYKKKRWGEIYEDFSIIPFTTIRDAVNKHFPGLWKELRKRHRHLRKIYLHCSNRHFSAGGQRIRVAGKKIGRNDPCPCGSGKKYKKCCLNK